jgi:hypothetical protein
MLQFSKDRGTTGEAIFAYYFFIASNSGTAGKGKDV